MKPNEYRECDCTEIHYSIFKLKKRSNAQFVVLFTGQLDDVAIIINVLTLLLENETLEKLIQDTVSGQEFTLSSVFIDKQHFGDQVRSNFFRLSGEDTKGKLAKLRGRVVQKKSGEDHTRGKTVHLDSSGSFRLGVSLNTFIQFLHKTVSQLWQSTLGRSVARISRGTSSLHTASDCVENVSGYTSLQHQVVR
jgi:hypothetical protein